MPHPRFRAMSLPLLLLLSSCATPQQVAPPAGAPATDETHRGPDAVDLESTKAIRAATTEPGFSTEWVDYVPQSDAVPSPRDFLGHVIGSADDLTPPERIAAYFRELERTSGRVRVFSMGMSHGQREMIVAAVADASLLERLDEITDANHRLADPRTTDEDAARHLAASIPASYWLTGGLHSVETGSSEMLMELAYRLAVSDQPHVKEIREHVLTLVTPVLEVDGRARVVDWQRRHLKGVTDLDDAPPLSPPYWGDYVLHDNNRDGLQMSQALTRNYVETFHRFRPTVSLDLHESIPLLYVSTGTGPYNETIDPITIAQWQWMASWDVSQATALGLRGVWTWGFYTGWYPGYLLWVTNEHNAIGRFYETFGNSLPGTFERDLRHEEFASERVETRQWYRPWPPEGKLRWSLRDNTNYMETCALAALQLAARNGDSLLLDSWRKAKKAIERGKTQAPFAWHVPLEQRDRGALHELLRLLHLHRIEVSRAPEALDLADGEHVAAGDFLVRMDQPCRDFAQTLFERQEFPSDAPYPPYDDVSWSLPLMLGIEAHAVNDPEVLQKELEPVDDVPGLAGTAEDGSRWIVDHRGQPALASLAWSLSGAQLAALSEEWDGHPRGSLVIGGVEADQLRLAIAGLHLDAKALDPAAEPPAQALALPRIAIYHTWRFTQNSGWARYTFEQLGIPFTLIDKDDVRAGDLGKRFDVIVVPDQGGLSLADIVQGIDTRWSPLAYTNEGEFPSHGKIDSSPDITGGMGFAGLDQLSRFVSDGGLLITLGSAGVLAADSGIARAVRSAPRPGTPGSHLTAKVVRPEHPVTWGFDEVTSLFRGNLPLYTVRDHDLGMVVMQLGTKTQAELEREADKKAGIEPPGAPPAAPAPKDAAKPAERPPLCLSGSVRDPSALEGRPALLDVPVGRGRVLVFGWNPLHRFQNRHDFAFLTNALLFHDRFPPTPTTKVMRAREEAGGEPAPAPAAPVNPAATTGAPKAPEAPSHP